MRLRRLAAMTALALGGLLGAVACSSSGHETSGGGSNLSGPQPAAPRAESKAEAAGADKPGSGQSGSGQSGASQVSAQGRHVVRTAAIDLEVDDVTGAAASARGMAERFDGFVVFEQSDSDRASLSLRVATDRLDEALTALGELGEVTNREQKAEDVTEQVVDVQTRIANQKASVDRVRVLLDRAATVGEVVQIESELTTRQAELESLQNRAATLADQTQLATVAVSITGRDNGSGGAPGTEDERTGFLPGLAAGWNAFADTVAVMLTVLGAVMPFALAIGLPIAVALHLMRRRRAAARAAES